MRAYITSKYNISVPEILEQLREDIHSLPADIEAFAKKIFFSPDIKKFIIEANQRLLSQGLRPDLTDIEKIPEGDQKSAFYERYTIYQRTKGKGGYKEGSQSQFIDLYKTGFFYGSLEVRAGSKELLEFSSDPKAVELERVWGDILGISSEDLIDLLLLIRPKIITFVNNKLKLKT